MARRGSRQPGAAADGAAAARAARAALLRARIARRRAPPGRRAERPVAKRVAPRVLIRVVIRIFGVGQPVVKVAILVKVLGILLVGRRLRRLPEVVDQIRRDETLGLPAVRVIALPTDEVALSGCVARQQLLNGPIFVAVVVAAVTVVFLAVAFLAARQQLLRRQRPLHVEQRRRGRQRRTLERRANRPSPWPPSATVGGSSQSSMSSISAEHMDERVTTAIGAAAVHSSVPP